MRHLPGILAFLIAGAGWYYMFYSQAGARLTHIEHPKMNEQRLRLRRLNGFAMLLLGALFYIGFYGVNDHEQPAIFLAVWSFVIILLIMIVMLALIDIRLTIRLRRK